MLLISGTKIPRFKSASKVLLTGAKFIFKQQYSSDVAFERQAKLYIVEKLLKIIKQIKNSVRLILDNFRIVVYPFSGHIPMDSSHYSLHFDSILSPKYLILKVLKRNFNPSVQTI